MLYTTVSTKSVSFFNSDLVVLQPGTPTSPWERYWTIGRILMSLCPNTTPQKLTVAVDK